MWRFKTKKEFERDGLWDPECGCPFGWDDQGKMNKFMGQPVPDKYVKSCEAGDSLYMGGWFFRSCDYVKIELDKPTEVVEDSVAWLKKFEDEGWKVTSIPNKWMPEPYFRDPLTHLHSGLDYGKTVVAGHSHNGGIDFKEEYVPFIPQWHCDIKNDTMARDWFNASTTLKPKNKKRRLKVSSTKISNNLKIK